MCRNTLSVSWDGRLFDCDFNQMLDIEATLDSGDTLRIESFNSMTFKQRTVRVDRHCFAARRAPVVHVAV